MRTTHVGINRARSVAQDQLLFTQERLDTLATAAAFFAQVTVPTGKAALLEEAINGEHTIGRGRSRGNGRVVMEIIPSAEYPALGDRLFDFQLALQSAFDAYRHVDNRVRSQMPGTFFTLTLRSSAILHEAGRPLRVPTPAMLGLSQADRVRCLRAWARMETAGGWDSAAQLPRRKAPAVRAGSAYLFWADEAVDRKRLEEELAGAELRALGDERERGYGQFTVCASFHYHMQ
jgi:CRISPR-associated Csx10 family RAMP protein